MTENTSKIWNPRRTQVAMATTWQNLKKLCQKPLPDFEIIWQKCFLHGRHGQGKFSIYACVRNFKSLFLCNIWPESKIVSNWTLTKRTKTILISIKTWRSLVGLIFHISLYRSIQSSVKATMLQWQAKR